MATRERASSRRDLSLPVCLENFLRMNNPMAGRSNSFLAVFPWVVLLLRVFDRTNDTPTVGSAVPLVLCAETRQGREEVSSVDKRRFNL